MKKPLNETFFMASFIAGSVIILFLSAMILNIRDADALPALLFLTFIVVVYLAVVSMMLFFRAWQAIQDGHARTTPGKAIGFAFIPFFNFYWAFQMIWGYSKDFNAYIQRHEIKVNPLNEKLFLTATMMAVAGVIINRIPLFGLLYSVGSMVVSLLMCYAVIQGVNALAESGVEVKGMPAMKVKEILTDDKILGIIAIFFSSYAILYQLLMFARLYRSGLGGFILTILSLGYWGVVIYLGYLCKHPTLRIVAMCLPLAPFLLQFVQVFRYLF